MAALWLSRRGFPQAPDKPRTSACEGVQCPFKGLRLLLALFLGMMGPILLNWGGGGPCEDPHWELGQG